MGVQRKEHMENDSSTCKNAFTKYAIRGNRKRALLIGRRSTDGAGRVFGEPMTDSTTRKFCAVRFLKVTLNANVVATEVTRKRCGRVIDDVAVNVRNNTCA